MKKILALVTVLALVAALVVPMAVSAATGPVVTASPNVEVTGAVVAPTVAVTAPTTGISLGTFVGTGWTNGGSYDWSSADGTINITPNSYPNATATVTVQSKDYGSPYGNFTNGCMYDGRYMDYPLYVTVGDGSLNPEGSASYLGDGSDAAAIGAGAATFTETADSAYYSLGAKQYVVSADLAAGPGNYTFYMTVTAQVNY
jgi:hypothetical protein